MMGSSPLFVSGNCELICKPVLAGGNRAISNLFRKWSATGELQPPQKGYLELFFINGQQFAQHPTQDSSVSQGSIVWIKVYCLLSIISRSSLKLIYCVFRALTSNKILIFPVMDDDIIYSVSRIFTAIKQLTIYHHRLIFLVFFQYGKPVFKISLFPAAPNGN